MNEAQKILRKEIDTLQDCIKNIEMDIKMKKEVLVNHKKNLKTILEALMVLESEKDEYHNPKGVIHTVDKNGKGTMECEKG